MTKKESTKSKVDLIGVTNKKKPKKSKKGSTKETKPKDKNEKGSCEVCD